MAKLNQIVAVVKGKKTYCQATEITETELEGIKATLEYKTKEKERTRLIQLIKAGKT
jgi:hypothetical protein